MIALTADFADNYVYSSAYHAKGGAIYNGKRYAQTENDIFSEKVTKIDNIKGNFNANYAESKYDSAYGGAIYNGDTIGSISGTFSNNYVKSHDIVEEESSSDSRVSYADGGAIYNDSEGVIDEIKADFVGNHAESAGRASEGGAIHNDEGTINKLTYSTFIGNYSVSADGVTKGGALYNYGTINEFDADFYGNYVKSGNNKAHGGAVYNDKEAYISNITGTFYENHAIGGTEAMGGAIYNGKESIIGDKDKNGNIVGGIVNSSFINNYVQSSSGKAQGGAIYTNNDLNIIADNGKSVFSGNYAESNGDKTPNAIYAKTYDWDTTISDNIVSIEDNKVTYKEITESNIKSPTLTLTANNNGVIVFDDTIDGNVTTFSKTITTTTTEVNYVVDDRFKDKGVSTLEEYIDYAKDHFGYDDDITNEEVIANGLGNDNLKIEKEQIISTETNGEPGKKYNYTLALNGEETGAIYLNNEIKNANITIDNTNVYVNEGTNFAQSRSLAVNSGVLNINHLANQTVNFEKFSNAGNINLASIDVDLAYETMGRITAKEYGESTGKINVQGLNLLSDATKDVTNILFADEKIAGSVSYTGASPIAYSPIWKYDVSYNPDDGFFTFSRGGSSSGNASSAFNPAVLAPAVSAQAGAYTTQLQAFNYAFQHADTFMNIPYLERVAMINANKYAMSPTGDATDVGVFSPLLLKEPSAGFWVKPYASFENIPLKNGPKVDNINYGTLVGYDTALTPVKHGFERVITGYVGYNGASQRYSGVDAYQNGGLIGTTATFYKGNFFNATTLSVGASVGDASTMYGSENYTMLLAGIGNKTGYNFEFFDGGMILQPNFLISYTFVNTFDYNNAAGVRIESDPLHAIQLAPGIKLIGNTKNGWQPYLGVNMVWNLLDDSKVYANDVRLPEMSIKPYVQYGVGLQKRFKDKFLAFGQAMIHNGGRNGISFSFGLRWKIGKD